MYALLIFSFLCAPFEVEVTSGLGGIIWEEPVVVTVPAMESSSMTAWTARMHMDGHWWAGASMLLNAYKGRHPDFAGPIFGVMDVMGYYRIKMGHWQLNLGMGAAVGVLHVRRYVAQPVGEDVPPGHYELFVPSVYAAFSGAFLHRLHPRLLVGVSLRYYSGLNGGPCWEGPASDCEGVDRQTQHWAFGASVIVISP